MTTLPEHIIVAGDENRPPMLEKSMYDSWTSRIHLFIKGKKIGRMMLDSIDNGLLVYLTVEENGQTGPKKNSELTEAQQLQDDCDVQATNNILHGLLLVMYALVNHQEEAKDIWDRVKLLMKGIELSYQKCEYGLYNLFDKCAYVQGETLYEYYWRFSQLINDMHTIRMIMQQVQVNTKFLNALLPEWSKFVTDVKLTKSLYTTNYDQLYTYLSQHERHANEQGDDPIECINKAMEMIRLNALRKQWNSYLLWHQEQAFWLKHLNYNPDTSVKSHTPVRIEAPSELPRDNFSEKQNAPTFNQLFEINELKAQSQEKDTVIRKLKDKIKYLSRKDNVENAKKDINEIDTINIELEHIVEKLLFKNENLRKEREHLKSIYKDQFDSIRKTRVQSKEHYDSLIAQINEKSVENSDLNAQLQEKVLLLQH
nr:hypothetical protein [Tanacetum cinerariifolium]